VTLVTWRVLILATGRVRPGDDGVGVVWVWCGYGADARCVAAQAICSAKPTGFGNELVA